MIFDLHMYIVLITNDFFQSLRNFLTNTTLVVQLLTSFKHTSAISQPKANADADTLFSLNDDQAQAWGSFNRYVDKMG